MDGVHVPVYQQQSVQMGGTHGPVCIYCAFIVAHTGLFAFIVHLLWHTRACLHLLCIYCGALGPVCIYCAFIVAHTSLFAFIVHLLWHT